MNQQQIYQPDGTFVFNNLKLLPPTIINSGQFIKFKINGSPLLIQSPKCTTKPGTVVNKKNTTDLIFATEDNEPFLQWIETLETHCQKALFDNRAEWFDKEWSKNINEITDIDDYFRNILKSFKSAKYYSMGVSVLPDLKIYDENEEEIDITKIFGTDSNQGTNLLCILEFEGIKCNLSNFQIQIKVRQMMTIQPIFSKCLIKKTNVLGGNTSSPPPSSPPSPPFNAPPTATTEKNDNAVSPPNQPTSFYNSKIEEPQLVETTLKFDEMDDAVELKDRKEIFMELYKNAKEKAKMARHLALMAYLEKNQIKNTYMLQDIESDDDDELYE